MSANNRQEDLSRYLWKGLDLNRYAVVKILPQNRREAVIVMQCKEESNPHWCLEYRGGGHYFSTFAQLTEYFYKRRFKGDIYD